MACLPSGASTIESGMLPTSIARPAGSRLTPVGSCCANAVAARRSAASSRASMRLRVNDLLFGNCGVLDDHRIAIARAEILVDVHHAGDEHHVADGDRVVRGDGEIVVAFVIRAGAVAEMDPVLAHDAAEEFDDFAAARDFAVFRVAREAQISATVLPAAAGGASSSAPKRMRSKV